MVSDVEETLDLWLSVNAKRYIIHLSSTKNILKCINLIRESGKEVYIGVSIGDDVSILKECIEHIDGVQCMGISNIGSQGEPYDSRVFQLIESVKEINSDIPISVDGGMSVNTISMLSCLGISQFVVGSALYKGDVEKNFTELLKASY